MTGAGRRAARVREAAALVGHAADVLRARAAQDMHQSRTRGEIGVLVAALVEAVARHMHDVPSEVAHAAAFLADLVHRSEDPPKPQQPWRAGG